MSLYKKRLGIDGEKIALSFLQKRGFSIIQTNFRCKFGEIDIIAVKDKKLHFIEVKTRSSLDKGQPYEAVNQRKLLHIKNTIDYYLLKNNLKHSKLSIDVVAILVNRDDAIESIKLYENVTL